MSRFAAPLSPARLTQASPDRAAGARKERVGKPRKPGKGGAAAVATVLLVVAGCVLAAFFLIREIVPHQLELPENVGTAHPGPMNWYQEMDGEMHRWTVDDAGTFHYVGKVEREVDPDAASARSSRSSDMARQRRESIARALRGER